MSSHVIVFTETWG